ncbi:hypothetical protein MAR_013409 [Mya arenaria]|uniref:Uncharacterized protein n=1 Tax=Mya arenaria TaxID=6604 RepID=A0ABY7G0F9_MYAAR|nr:hypothetical protein MAR_013409 [Mya arenaria]
MCNFQNKCLFVWDFIFSKAKQFTRFHSSTHNTDNAMWFTAESPLSECKCTLLIRCSKTDQYGNSVSLIFTQTSDSTLCPLLAVKLYLSVRPNIDGPLFCHFSWGPLTKYQFRAMLMKCLKFCGTRPNFKSHYFRIDATTLASMLNIPDEDIQIMGRW